VKKLVKNFLAKRCALISSFKAGENYYEIDNDGELLEVPFSDVIDIKPFSSDGLNGLSVIDALKEDINAQRFAKKLSRTNTLPA
jgi:hypothetical protein